MAIVIGTKTSSILPQPAGTTHTISYTCTAGSNNYLYVVTTTPIAVSYSGVTYAGIVMTKITEQTTLTTNERIAIWQLANPTTGTAQNVVVTFTAGTWDPSSVFIFSASGANGYGNIVFDNTATAPNTTTITVSANSMVFTSLIAGNNVSHNITIDGSSRTLEYTHNIYNYTSGALSAILSAGSKNISVSSTSDLASLSFEIKEAVTAPTSTQGMLMMF
jgi:hypothetical protein